MTKNRKMNEATGLLHEWYSAVENGFAPREEFAKAVMDDPENGIIFSRLANCAAKSVAMFLELAKRDSNPDTLRMVRDAMRNELSDGDS